jgi:hypothetical protein
VKVLAEILKHGLLPVSIKKKQGRIVPSSATGHPTKRRSIWKLRDWNSIMLVQYAKKLGAISHFHFVPLRLGLLRCQTKVKAVPRVVLQHRGYKVRELYRQR